MLKKVLRMFFRLLRWALVLGLAALILPRLVTALYAPAYIYSVENVPVRRAAIVFGAGLSRDGSPTPVLRDRVETAAELYFAGKVEKLLMSGDNRFIEYNEPEAMRQYALSLGVPDEAIVLDYAGRRTYDTCYRARAIFGLDQALVVTQYFHLPRVLVTCRGLGIDAVGVAADRREYRLGSLLYWNLRELPATLTAFLDVYILHTQPVLGNPEPIFLPQAQ
jgi:SanA protein